MKDQNNTPKYDILSKNFFEDNIRVVLGLFGIHCGIVSLILYASM